MLFRSRDTPETLKAYLASFGSDFVGLTGSDQEIAAVAKEYRVYYKKADESDPENYAMDHTSLLYLMDPNGKLVALFRTGATPDDLAAGIKAAFAKAMTWAEKNAQMAVTDYSKIAMPHPKGAFKSPVKKAWDSEPLKAKIEQIGRAHV